MKHSFTIYTSDRIGAAENTLYPHAVTVDGEEPFRNAVQHDYVAVEYLEGRRSTGNFIRSDCVVMDCDNDHSEDPESWVTPEDIRAAMPDVVFGVHYSRNSGRPKNGKAARPRFHCFFPVAEQTDPAKYAAMKRRILEIFPFFDPNAVDAARFFFGTAEAGVELFDGELTIDSVLDEHSAADALPDGTGYVIPEGRRNSTLSRFAARVLIRLGDCDEAYDAFLNESGKCSTPLENAELDAIWKSALSFWEKISSQPGYIPPESYGKEFRYLPADITDVGQAQTLAKEFINELRYSPATGYMFYNGSFWEESAPQARGIAQKLTGLQLAEARAALEKAEKKMKDCGAANIILAKGEKKAVPLFTDEQTLAYAAYQKAAKYESFALKRRSSNGISAALTEAEPMLPVSVQQLDADPFLLCTPDATYDVRFGLAGKREHRPEDFITKCTAVSPDDNGAELWQKQLELVFCGDRELIEYAQLTAGIVCVGKVYVEKLIIAYGSGANGKSTFWNTIARVLGTYSGTISADTLIAGTSRNTNPERAELKGKRLVIASELDEGLRFSTATVKNMTSTDPIHAEKKYKDPFDFLPSHTLVLYTNHLPRVGASDLGTWRRMLVMPFKASLQGSGDKKNYTDYLVENAGGAVLSWIIEGARKVIEKGFDIEPPAVVAEATAQYREQNDWLAHFIEDCCDTGEGLSEKSGEFYQAYRSYCADNSEFAKSTTVFYTALKEAGYDRHKTEAGSFILGLKLKPDTDEFLS